MSKFGKLSSPQLFGLRPMNTDVPEAGDYDRHLSDEGLKKYVESNTPGIVQVGGEPNGYLVIDPIAGRLAIQVPADGPVPNCAKYENVSVARVRREGADWNELSVETGDQLEDVYPLLCQVLDRVQLEGRLFSHAVQEVLRVYRKILHLRSALGEADQVGLYGELLVLEHLIPVLGANAAMGSWLGPLHEEHDFAFSGLDLEVKATTSDTRSHWISSATQLTPTKGKLLYLISIQITPTGEGGRTLPELVAAIHTKAPDHADPFSVTLERLGYHVEDADLYPSRWILRTLPAAYLVDETFPAITSQALREIVPQANRLVEIRYRVNLAGLTPSAASTQMSGFVEEPG